MNYEGYKECFIDVETTGTDRKLHNIFQIAGAIRSKEGEVLEAFDLRFRPFSLQYVSDEALEKTGMTIADLEALPMSAEEAYKKFISILSKHCNRFDKKDKMQFIAFNAGFDSEFMREFFIKMGDNYFGSWFWTPSVCVMQLCALWLFKVRGSLPNFRLGTLCEASGLGWDEEKAHNALYDILKSIELFDYVKKIENWE